MYGFHTYFKSTNITFFTTGDIYICIVLRSPCIMMQCTSQKPWSRKSELFDALYDINLYEF